MEGEEGGVAASLIPPVGEPWEGGDVEGTAKLTARPSSVSPRQPQTITLPHIRLDRIKPAVLCGNCLLTCWRLARLN